MSERQGSNIAVFVSRHNTPSWYVVVRCCTQHNNKHNSLYLSLPFVVIVISQTRPAQSASQYLWRQRGWDRWVQQQHHHCCATAWRSFDAPSWWAAGDNPDTAKRMHAAAQHHTNQPISDIREAGTSACCCCCQMAQYFFIMGSRGQPGHATYLKSDITKYLLYFKSDVWCDGRSHWTETQ